MGVSSRWALTCLFACLLLTASAQSAQAYLYVADANNNTIGRANLDGTNFDPAFISAATSFPLQLAVNDTHLFWANQNSNSISRANVDGSNAMQIASAQVAQGVAVNSTNLFWTSNPGGSIVRGERDGSLAAQLPGPSGAFNLAVSDSHLYWTEPGSSINRANLDGSDAEVLIPSSAYNLAIYGNHLYWINPGQSIGRANLDGTDADPTFISGLGSGSWALAVDAGHIYWANFLDGDVRRANLDGTNVEPAFLPTNGNVRALALDPPAFQLAGAASRDFGDVVAGSTSATQDVVVTNDGRGPLAVTGASLTGADAASFEISANTCTPIVDPSETCTVTVAFSPTAAGARAATLRIDHLEHAYGSPTSTDVTLSGSGLPRPAADRQPVSRKPPSPDTVAPRFAPAPYFTPSAFEAAGRGPANSARAKVGSRVSFTLSEAAAVRFSVQRKRTGRRDATGRCLRGTPATKTRRRCALWPRIPGSFTVAGTQGKNTLRFRGRVGGKALERGRYR